MPTRLILIIILLLLAAAVAVAIIFLLVARPGAGPVEGTPAVPSPAPAEGAGPTITFVITSIVDAKTGEPVKADADVGGRVRQRGSALPEGERVPGHAAAGRQHRDPGDCAGVSAVGGDPEGRGVG